MNLKYLAFHAAERPDDLAFVDGERCVSFVEMQREVHELVPALPSLGLRRGSSIAIGCDSLYLHWLLILACEHLGIASASFQAQEGRLAAPLLGSVDMVLAEPHYPTGGWNTRTLTPEWLQSVFARPDSTMPPAVTWQPDDILRIVRTSGTTGEAKRMNMGYRELEARTRQLVWLHRELPMGSGSLVTFSFAIGATYAAASLALRCGIALVAGGRTEIAELPALIRRYRLSAITLLPVQLKDLLDLLPSDWVKPDHIEITTLGAPVSEELRQRALERLAVRVVDVYGSNEVGVITVIRYGGAAGFGTIVPGVEVEIVDDSDRPLPDGSAGRVRIRRESDFRGYADDAPLTRRMVQDGWFYPGDLGILQGARLQIVGRDGDLVNLGGVKYPLSRIEASVQASGGPGVRDVGAVAIPNEAGLNEVHIALVTDGHDDRAVLDRVIAALRPIVVGGLHLVRLPLIPRNQMGKIDRTKLKETILALHAEAGQA